MKKTFKEFLNEDKNIDINSIRSKLGTPSYKDMVNNFSSKKKFDPWKLITYSFEISIIFEGFEPTILEGTLILSEEPKKEEVESRIKDRLKVFHNISSYQILNFEKAKDQIKPMN